MKDVFTKEQAITELSHDVIRENIYDLIDAVGAEHSPEESSIVYADDEKCDKKDEYNELLEKFKNWLNGYKEISRSERMNVSDIIITEANKHYVHGVMLLVNGMNGMTQVSRQSLKQVTDVISHLEDHYGARAYISYVSTHSDVYYYGITFVIWDDSLKAEEEHNWGNLKPLYHIK